MDSMTVELPQKLRAERAMRRMWFPVARSVDLEKPQSALLLGEKLVVYRTESGKAVVQPTGCPHRGASFADGWVAGESIACPYHGWQFSGHDGKCTHIPAIPDQSRIPTEAKIKTYPVIERFAHVWTVLEEPIADLYEPERWKNIEWDWLAGPRLDSNTGVAFSVENFIDVAHFSFVHVPSMGPSPYVIEPLKVRREGLDVFMDRPLDAGEGEWANDGDCMMHYQAAAPGFASILYDYQKLGKRIVAGFPSPVAYDQVRIFWGVANEKGYKGASLEECLKIEEMVYREDMPIAAAVEPREVDWDGVYDEFSSPADLFTLQYRRAFRDFMSRLG